jgi:hypothetical protein
MDRGDIQLAQQLALRTSEYIDGKRQLEDDDCYKNE